MNIDKEAEFLAKVACVVEEHLTKQGDGATGAIVGGLLGAAGGGVGNVLLRRHLEKKYGLKKEPTFGHAALGALVGGALGGGGGYLVGNSGIVPDTTKQTFKGVDNAGNPVQDTVAHGEAAQDVRNAVDAKRGFGQLLDPVLDNTVRGNLIGGRGLTALGLSVFNPTQRMIRGKAPLETARTTDLNKADPSAFKQQYEFRTEKNNLDHALLAKIHEAKQNNPAFAKMRTNDVKAKLPLDQDFNDKVNANVTRLGDPTSVFNWKAQNEARMMAALKAKYGKRLFTEPGLFKDQYMSGWKKSLGTVPTTGNIAAKALASEEALRLVDNLMRNFETSKAINDLQK